MSMNESGFFSGETIGSRNARAVEEVRTRHPNFAPALERHLRDLHRLITEATTRRLEAEKRVLELEATNRDLIHEVTELQAKLGI